MGSSLNSAAYSTLLGGQEFRRWREANPALAPGSDARVDYEREADHVVLTLNASETHNSMTAAMRDALYSAQRPGRLNSAA